MASQTSPLSCSTLSTDAGCSPNKSERSMCKSPASDKSASPLSSTSTRKTCSTDAIQQNPGTTSTESNAERGNAAEMNASAQANAHALRLLSAMSVANLAGIEAVYEDLVKKGVEMTPEVLHLFVRTALKAAKWLDQATLSEIVSTGSTNSVHTGNFVQPPVHGAMMAGGGVCHHHSAGHVGVQGGGATTAMAGGACHPHASHVGGVTPTPTATGQMPGGGVLVGGPGQAGIKQAPEKNTIQDLLALVGANTPAGEAALTANNPMAALRSAAHAAHDHAAHGYYAAHGDYLPPGYYIAPTPYDSSAYDYYSAYGGGHPSGPTTTTPHMPPPCRPRCPRRWRRTPPTVMVSVPEPRPARTAWRRRGPPRQARGATGAKLVRQRSARPSSTSDFDARKYFQF